MRKIFTRLIESEETKVEDVLKGALFVLILLSAVGAPLFFWFGPRTNILEILTIILFLSSLGLWYLANKGFFAAVKIGVVILFFTIVSVALFAEFGTIRTASTGSYMLVIAITAVLFLGNGRAIFSVFLASLAAVIILYTRERNQPPLVLNSSLGQELLVYFIQYSILTAILYYATRGFIQALQKLRKLNSELDQQVLRRTKELEQANEQLKQQAQELEQLSEYKSKILERATHELRTPLTSLSTYLHILSSGRHGQLSPKQKEHLERCTAETKYLNSLINDLLHLGLTKPSETELKQRNIFKDELVWIVNLIISQHETVLKANHVTVSMECEKLSFPIYSDPERLRHILAILLDNAFKFTSAGKVQLKMYDLDDNCWQILITDSGIGIPTHEQVQVFDPFHQAYNIPQRSRSGLGIGLSIAKQLTFVLGGKITVESQEGKGSTFSVILPRTHY